MKRFVFILLSTLILSCAQSPKMQYKFGDKEQTIACSNQNNALLNEALHSFENDLQNYKKTDRTTLISAYGQFMYKGIQGSAAYQEIANDHSLAIRDQLLEEGILITNGPKSNLNYKHPAVQCLVDNIEDGDVQKTIKALLDTNSMDPTLFNSRLRNFGPKAQKNRNQALYIALDAYYQNLVGITLEQSLSNE